MPKISSGLLLYRKVNNELEVLLVHMGGPFWAKKDLGSWSIPKGEVGAEEDLLLSAKREFAEEMGSLAPEGEYVALGSVTQKGGKVVHAFAIEGDFEGQPKSNTFFMEWPPRSGKQQEFLEVDRAEWFTREIAKEKILESQKDFLERLVSILSLNIVDYDSF